MPDIKTVESLAASHGVAIAILIVLLMGSITANVALFRQVQQVHELVRVTLQARSEFLERLLREGWRSGHSNP